MLRKHSSINSVSDSPLDMYVEPLEARMLLSVVTVAASGDQGGELFKVLIDGQHRETFESTTQYTEYRIDIAEDVSAEQVRVEFFNDFYDPENGIDRNLNVDFITVDGHRYETEAANTFASGVWDSQSGSLIDGFTQSEKLAGNGFFDFQRFPIGNQNNLTTIIEIDAIDSGGDGERFDLQIKGETVAQYVLQDNILTGGFDGARRFTFEAQGHVSADDVRIVFTNDAVFTTSFKGMLRTVDRNLTINSISVAGIKYYTDSDAVFSTGVWDSSAGGVIEGFGKGNTLHTNGYFQYSSNTAPSTTIQINAFNSTGLGERLDLQISGKTVAQYEIQDIIFTGQSQAPRQFTFVATGEVAPEDVRIVFTNDAVTETFIAGVPATLDRNLTIDSISIDGVTILTDSSDVFSTGIWDSESGGPRAGFGKGNTLHTNGYFQYGSRLRYQDNFA